MANKVAPKISRPGRGTMPTRGPHNPNVGTSGSGMAPRPQGGAVMPGNDRPSHPGMGGIARVKNAGSSPSGQGNTAGSFMSEQNNSMANIMGRQIGQAEANLPSGARISPMTRTPVTGNQVATKKPKRKGIGAAFYGE